jgi:hypothetical protein
VVDGAALPHGDVVHEVPSGGKLPQPPDVDPLGRMRSEQARETRSHG